MFLMELSVFSLVLNTHFTPMMFFSSGLSTSSQVQFFWIIDISSSISFYHLESWWASSFPFGSDCYVSPLINVWKGSCASDWWIINWFILLLRFIFISKQLVVLWVFLVSLFLFMEMNISCNDHLLSLRMLYFVGFKNKNIAYKNTWYNLFVKLIPLDLWNVNKTYAANFFKKA
jgi:hypothetical protein